MCQQYQYRVQWPFPNGRNSLAGASACDGELLSQTTKTMLLGAIITTAGLFILTMTAAMGYITFRK
jgi:hypothetical protein